MLQTITNNTATSQSDVPTNTCNTATNQSEVATFPITLQHFNYQQYAAVMISTCEKNIFETFTLTNLQILTRPLIQM